MHDDDEDDVDEDDDEADEDEDDEEEDDDDDDDDDDIDVPDSPMEETVKGYVAIISPSIRLTEDVSGGTVSVVESTSGTTISSD